MRLAICNLLVLLAVLGCDSKPAVEAVKAKVVERGPGVIRGRVTFEGEAPKPRKIDNSICHGAGEIYEEDVVVAPDGGLKNAIVYIDGVRDPEKPDQPTPVLDQIDCRFVPHVVAVRVGQTLRVSNSEAEMHNVHGNPKNNSSFNKSFMGKGTQDMTFARPDIFKVTCDVHPWMKAYIGVFESSFFAVTGDDGSFEITGLPAGTWELKVWHERFGVQQKTIQTEAEPVETGFVYKLEGSTAN